MSKLGPKNQILKDIAIVTILGGLLVALPIAKNSWGKSISASTELGEDKAFIAEIFPVVSSWDYKEAEPYFADQTISASEETVKAVFNTLSTTLGSLESFAEPMLVEGGDQTFARAARDVSLSTYSFNAEFEYGDAEVEIVLADNAQSTEIYAVNIDALL